MYRYILDASALLALINKEEGSEKVEEVLPFSIMSSVNVSECAAVLTGLDIPEKEVVSLLKDLVTEIIPFDENHAFEAGMLRKATKTNGLSLGDRSCLSLGKIMKLPVMTADKIWQRIDCGVVIKCIR